MAKVIRYCVKDESHNGENNFLVHRPFIFSNPFTHIKDKKTKAKYVVSSREEAIELYDEYFDTMLEMSPQFKTEFDKMYEIYKTSDEMYIGCYCALNEQCHGDIIIDKLKKRSIKDMLSMLKEKRQET